VLLKCLAFVQVLSLFLHVKQGHVADHSSSKPGMIILEGDTDVADTSEDNNLEANKKTDEMTGYTFNLHEVKLLCFVDCELCLGHMAGRASVKTCCGNIQYFTLWTRTQPSSS